MTEESTEMPCEATCTMQDDRFPIVVRCNRTDHPHKAHMHQMSACDPPAELVWTDK